MTTSTHTDGSFPLTTTSARAAALYRGGVNLFIRSSDAALATFDAAVALDGGFAVAIAAAALASRSESSAMESAAVLGRALRAARSATRRERQHVEILGFFVHGERSHANALAAAHLAEFPHDTLIAYVRDCE